MQNDMPNEKEWYAKVVAYGNADPLNYYYYAQALRFCGEYPGARRMFLKYDSIVPQDRRGRTFAGYCDSAMAWRGKIPSFQIKNAKFLNSMQSDFGAVIYDTGIMFASDRIVPGQKGETYGWTGNNYLRLYCSEPTQGGDFNSGFPPPGLGPEALNQGWHDGPVSFNKTFTEIFINRTILYHDKGKKEHGNFRTHLLKIYTATMKDDIWSKPEPFFLNSDDYSVGHPSLSPDGQTLFFVSDMPGGFGGTDLYMCTREGGQWGQPVNLGNVVNTFGNEMFPYQADNGDLYFASDGLPGFGGLDIFVSRKINGQWSRPENLGIPLNSSCDDFALIFARDGVSGLFSSNRPGGEGSDDIYSFKKIKVTPKVIPAPEKIATFVSGYVKDKTTKEPIPVATVFLAEEGTRQALVIKTNEMGFFKTPVKKGKSYTVKAIQTDYIEDCFLFGFDTLTKQNDLALPRDLLLDKIEINKAYRLDNIYYDFDKWNIRKDAQPSLDNLVTLMRENQITIELGSHTDCRGSVEYNNILSQKRAESAVRYIANHGIGFNRITAKGYGKSQLLNKCNCAKGVQCTEPEHQLNRRTEFRILSWVEDKSNSSVSPDNFKNGDVLEIKNLPEDFFDNCK
jgi:outer membrane protein OmpA-like peptidoglycan-associated protein